MKKNIFFCKKIKTKKKQKNKKYNFEAVVVGLVVIQYNVDGPFSFYTIKAEKKSFAERARAASRQMSRASWEQKNLTRNFFLLPGSSDQTMTKFPDRPDSPSRLLKRNN